MRRMGMQPAVMERFRIERVEMRVGGGRGNAVVDYAVAVGLFEGEGYVSNSIEYEHGY